MSTTVSEHLTRIARDLHEKDNTFPSGDFSQTEMIEYLNNAEKEFLLKTGILKTDSTIAVDAGTTILFDRPDNTMDIIRISVDGRPIQRQRLLDLELEDRNWRNSPNGRTHYWHEDGISNSQFEIDKRPAAACTIRVIADYIYDEYSGVSGNIHLADWWEPYLRWKVISLALSKDGDNQDIQRSK